MHTVRVFDGAYVVGYFVPTPLTWLPLVACPSMELALRALSMINGGVQLGNLDGLADVATPDSLGSPPSPAKDPQLQLFTMPTADDHVVAS